mmetsp:Transcript_31011/g.70067  ORF Transcript_31011/g.70067 Transcript_31011/m.70067 type:complete len:293 (+) Transcript_31011:141-1019(+)
MASYPSSVSGASCHCPTPTPTSGGPGGPSSCSRAPRHPTGRAGSWSTAKTPRGTGPTRLLGRRRRHHGRRLGEAVGEAGPGPCVLHRRHRRGHWSRAAPPRAGLGGESGQPVPLPERVDRRGRPPPPAHELGPGRGEIVGDLPRWYRGDGGRGRHVHRRERSRPGAGAAQWRGSGVRPTGRGHAAAVLHGGRGIVRNCSLRLRGTLRHPGRPRLARSCREGRVASSNEEGVDRSVPRHSPKLFPDREPLVRRVRVGSLSVPHRRPQAARLHGVPMRALRLLPCELLLPRGHL